MLLRQIPLKHGVNTRAIYVSDNTDINDALSQLEITQPKKVIVLVGGAGGIGFMDKLPMKKAVSIVAQLAQEMDAVILDGGTQAGIMTEIGNQRKNNKFSFPLIGVVFDALLIKEEPKEILDPNHTDFILIPGDDWGDESSWIAKIASSIAESESSITVLINGGEISQHDVQYSVMENRHVFIMRGTGRLADEITLTHKVTAIDIDEKPEKIMESLREKLL